VQPRALGSNLRDPQVAQIRLAEGPVQVGGSAPIRRKKGIQATVGCYQAAEQGTAYSPRGDDPGASNQYECYV
jgi:hypothetical protein